ncbi:MAG: hypothetical protein WC462_00990 [archaeon]
MSFGDFAREAKKNTPQRIPSGKPENLVEAAESQPAQKKDISYKDSEIKGFVPQQRTSMSRKNIDSRCGSIIRNIASESNIRSQTGGEATWEECRHRKNSNGRDFCSEYHSLCAKENCRKARK